LVDSLPCIGLRRPRGPAFERRGCAAPQIEPVPLSRPAGLMPEVQHYAGLQSVTTKTWFDRNISHNAQTEEHFFLNCYNRNADRPQYFSPCPEDSLTYFGKESFANFSYFGAKCYAQPHNFSYRNRNRGILVWYIVLLLPSP